MTETKTENKNIKINPVFEKLIPPLPEAQFKILEANILRSGCREPITLWNGIIIDGHHRYKICTKHNIPFKTVEEGLSSEVEAKMWMIDNQFGRRDVPTFMKIELALQFEDFEKELAQERMKSGKADPRQDLAQGKTVDRIGSKVGVSGEQVRRVKFILGNAPIEEIEELRLGAKSINESFMSTQEALQKQSDNHNYDPDDPGVKTTIDGKIFINSKFESLHPPGTKYGDRDLERRILEYGLEKPIDVWNGVIVDGHFRYRICCKHGLPYKTRENHFDSELDAMNWIVDKYNNPVGRQLNNYGWIDNLVKIKELKLEIEHKKSAAENKGDFKGIDINSQEHMTSIYRDGIDHEIPKEEIEKCLKIIELADEETKLAVYYGKMSVDKAYESLHSTP